MNSIQRLIQPLNLQIGFNVNSIQRQIQPLNHQIGFNVNFIQRNIQQLNCEIGFNVNSIQRIQPLNRQYDLMWIPFNDKFNHEILK